MDKKKGKIISFLQVFITYIEIAKTNTSFLGCFLYL